MLTKTKFSLIASVVLSFFKAAYPCYLTHKSLAKNPCVFLYSGINPFGKPNQYLVFCPRATVVQLDNGVTIPRVCSSFKDYLDTSVHSYKNEVHWSGRKGPDAWDRFTMHPYTADQDVPNDELYQKRFYRPAAPSYKPNNDGFSDNTEVWTRYGKFPISMITPGWRMISYDFSKGAWVETLVISVTKNSCNFVRIEFENNVIECSENQKFYLLKSKEWVCAKDLKDFESELLVKSDKDDSFSLQQVQTVMEIGERQTTCITLDKHHNFCVNGGFVVHNSMFVMNILGQLVPIFSELSAEFLGNLAQIGCSVGAFVFGDTIKEVLWNPSKEESKDQIKEQSWGCPEILAPLLTTVIGDICKDLTQPVEVPKVESICDSIPITVSKVDSSKIGMAGVFGMVNVGLIPFLKIPLYINVPSIAATGLILIYRYYTRKPVAPAVQLIKQQAEWIPSIQSIQTMQSRAIALQKSDIKEAEGYKDEMVAMTKDLYENLLKEAKEKSDNVDVLLEEMAMQNSKGKSEKIFIHDLGPSIPDCMNDYPEGDNESELRTIFESIVRDNSEKVVESFKSEVNDLGQILNHLKDVGNIRMYDKLKSGLDKIKTINRIPMTLKALGKITEKGCELFNSIKQTCFFYPFEEGPAIIYQAIKDISGWGLENGDYLYVDYAHDGDHIEVFHKQGAIDKTGKVVEGKAKDVRNFNSYRNTGKRKNALGFKLNKKTNIWEFKGFNSIRFINFWIGIKW